MTGNAVRPFPDMVRELRIRLLFLSYCSILFPRIQLLLEICSKLTDISCQRGSRGPALHAGTAEVISRLQRTGLFAPGPESATLSGKRDHRPVHLKNPEKKQPRFTEKGLLCQSRKSTLGDQFA